MTTGNKPTPAVQYPALGSLVTRLMPAEEGVPPYVAFSEIRGGSAGTAGFLGTAYNPFIVEGAAGGGKNAAAGNLRVRGIQLPTGFTLEELENRDKLLQGFDESFRAADKAADLAEGLDAFHKKALEILRSDRTKKAFDLAQESKEARERYGPTPFGQGALAARRLVEAGVRFVTISLGGWDTQASSGGRRRSTRTPAATTGRGRWRWCWRAAASSAATPTARPTRRGWPRRRKLARRTMCRPRSSTSWASTRTPSYRRRPAGRSSSSAKAR
jgi:hypothetical protein